MTNLPTYADIADGPEHERIAIIGRMAEGGKVVGFIVEDDEKADRYIRKLLRAYRVEVQWRGAGITPDTVMVRVGPRKEGA